MLTSEFIARNPRAVCDALETAIRHSYMFMQDYRRMRDSVSVLSDYYAQQAVIHKETLRELLAIRGGDW